MFWLIALIAFIALILHEWSWEKEAQSSYSKARLRMLNVHFSEMDQGFEHARMFADEVDMDDSQSNMNATSVRTLFFDKQVATRTGELIASWGFKTPFEARFWGDVRLRTSDGERLRTDNMRYFLSRKELNTTMPVTIWKDDMVITGVGMTYNTQLREGSLHREVRIRIWPSTASAPAADLASEGIQTRLPDSADIASSSPLPATATRSMPGATDPGTSSLSLNVTTVPRAEFRAATASPTPVTHHPDSLASFIPPDQATAGTRRGTTQ